MLLPIFTIIFLSNLYANESNIDEQTLQTNEVMDQPNVDETLKESQITEIEKQIAEINQQIYKLEKSSNGPSKNNQNQDHLISLRSKLSNLLIQKKNLEKPDNKIKPFWRKSPFDVSGFVVLDSTTGSIYDQGYSSKIAVSTIDLSIQKNFSEKVETYINWLYQNNVSTGIDQAFLNLKLGDKKITTFSIGKKNLPFGYNESHFASDSLIYSLSYLTETMAQVTTQWKEFSAGVFSYHSQSKMEESSSLGSYGGYLDYFSEKKYLYIIKHLRWSYLKRIGDISGFYDFLATDNSYIESPSAWIFSSTLNYKDFDFIVEFFKLNGTFSTDYLSFQNETARIQALQTELYWKFADKHSVQLGYQQSHDALPLGNSINRFPKKRYMLGTTWEWCDYLNVTLEHRIDKDYSDQEIGHNYYGDITGSGKFDRTTTLEFIYIFI